MKLLLAAAAALAGLAAPAAAQTADADVKVNQLIVYGDEPCPQGGPDEIVVCARKPANERFRIPEELRGVGDPRSESWAVRAEAIETMGRTGTMSCSPVGPGGHTGCFDRLVRQARAERAAGSGTDWNALIEEARQERLDRIDAQSEAIERELRGDE